MPPATPHSRAMTSAVGGKRTPRVVDARRRGGFERGWLIIAAMIIALAEGLAAMIPRQLDAGVLELVRVTARTSGVWFMLAFAATPLVALRPTSTTKWLLRNRRYLGLAMAVSHGST